MARSRFMLPLVLAWMLMLVLAVASQDSMDPVSSESVTSTTLDSTDAESETTSPSNAVSVTSTLEEVTVTTAEVVA